MKSSRLTSCALLMALFLGSVSQAEEWGTITGKFVLDGKAPAASALDITKDKEFCGKHDLKDESLIVGEKGGVANIALWVYVGRGKKAPAVHPDVAAKAKEKVVVDNTKCAYAPHISLVTTNQVVEFKNSDPIAHNFKVEGFANDSFNTLVPAGAAYEHKFPNEDSAPMNAGCSIHPWMNAKIIVKESPYMAVSQADGTFTIENVPAGELSFKLWHEKSGYVRDLEIAGEKTDRKGVFEIDVKAGANDLGEIKVPLSAFD